MKGLPRGLAWVTLAAVVGCGSVTGERPPESVTLCLPVDERAVPLEAELAFRPGQRQKGLRGRSRLARRAGMLFVYPQQQAPTNSFWMHQTPVPLTILFLDDQGVVRSIQDMVPCMDEQGSGCASYQAGVTHWMALEVNQGLPQALGITEGDTVTLSRQSDQASCDSGRPLTPGALPEAY